MKKRKSPCKDGVVPFKKTKSKESEQVKNESKIRYV